MKDPKDLHAQLEGVVLFRNVLRDGTVAAFLALLGAGRDEAVARYSDFASSLFAAGTDDWSRYLLDAVLKDENGYVRSVCLPGGASAGLADCLAPELALFEELSRVTARELAERIPFKGHLAAWTTEPLDFAAAYRAHIEGLACHGWGMFAQYHVFVVEQGALVPVRHPDGQKLSELYGYEAERRKVLANTEALLAGKPANNVLLYGDAGTGKSSTVKAIANELAPRGLRLIEVKKNQLYQIADVVEALSANPLKFILFIDDLSFSQNDADFAALKAILEGSVSACGRNVAVYATSNRRHLIKESFSDREGDEIHLYDTMQELMSLSARFGLTVTFSRPEKELYGDIVCRMAELYEIDMPKERLLTRAEAFAIRSGGRSPRTAKQFVELLASGVLPRD